MPAQRRSLRSLNISELAEVSGLSPSTVSANLNRSSIAPVVIGKRKVYDAPAALRYLLAGEELDPRVERAGSMPPEQISPSSSCGGSGVRSSMPPAWKLSAPP